jgi:hypothetical protein
MLQVMQDINKVSWQGLTVSVFATDFCENQIHPRKDSVPTMLMCQQILIANEVLYLQGGWHEMMLQQPLGS